MPLTLFLGFVLDVVTFRTIDILTSFILLWIYIVLVGVSIAIINIHDARLFRPPGKFISYVRLAAPLVLQFSFGALFSMAFIFYSFDGVISVDWPLVLLLLFLMISNEIHKQYYLKPTIQLSTYFFVLFVLMSLTLPYLFNSLSSVYFILSGILSVVLMALFVYLLIKKSPPVNKAKGNVAVSVLIILVLMNIFYFANMIPPIPLNMHDIGVYHNVVRMGNRYELTKEKESFAQKIVPGKIVHMTENSQIYIFASIFSPAKLNTEIVHHWQRYDTTKKEWVSMKKLKYGLIGGRAEGYRGYTLSSNVSDGKWRVYVETVRGQILGKIAFEVESVSDLPEMEKIFK